MGFWVLRFWDSDILRFWDYGVLGSEILGFWDSEILRFWDFGVLEFWGSEKRFGGANGSIQTGFLTNVLDYMR